MSDQFTLLSVDDDHFFLHTIKRSLEKTSIHVEIADNFITALDILQKTDINLLLLDIEMPGKNGFHF